MNFVTVAKVLAAVANTSSTSQKASLLTRFGELDGLKQVLKFIYDPYTTTGIGNKSLAEYLNEAATLQAIAPEQIMEYLPKNNTGAMRQVAIAAAFCSQYKDDPVALWAAIGLVTKDLQIGVSVTSLNKIYGDGFIPKIGIMRGMACPEHIRGNYIATEKIDGNRRLIITKPTGVEIYTRSGKRDYGLVEIEEQAKALPTGYVYDSECVAVGEFADSIELRQASASILNAKGRRKGVKSLCFDMLPLEEYNEGISSQSAIVRKAMLAGLFGQRESVDKLVALAQKHDGMHSRLGTIADKVGIVSNIHTAVELTAITALPIIDIVTNKQQAMDLVQPIWETGGEGLMLLEYLSKYEVNPNPRKTLLKIKQTEEIVLECVDVLEGSNKYTGMLGAITVKYIRPGDPTVYYVNVGSGFPDYLRELYWNEPERIIGAMVELDYSGESRNQNGLYSLSQPRFKRIKGDVE